MARSAVLAGGAGRRSDASREDRSSAATGVAAELVDRHPLPAFRQAPALYLVACGAGVQIRAVAAVLSDIRWEIGYRLHLFDGLEKFRMREPSLFVAEVFHPGIAVVQVPERGLRNRFAQTFLGHYSVEP